MSFPAVQGVAAATESLATQATLPSVSLTAAAQGTSAFSDLLASAVENVTSLQERSGELSVQAVSGELEDVHDYTIAATEAQVALELTATLRNRAVDAFTEIMRMQA
jgi:flagellar hook-basal body complex protein FliE